MSENDRGAQGARKGAARACPVLWRLRDSADAALLRVPGRRRTPRQSALHRRPVADLQPGLERPTAGTASSLQDARQGESRLRCARREDEQRSIGAQTRLPGPPEQPRAQARSPAPPGASLRWPWRSREAQGWTVCVFWWEWCGSGLFNRVTNRLFRLVERFGWLDISDIEAQRVCCPPLEG